MDNQKLAGKGKSLLRRTLSEVDEAESKPLTKKSSFGRLLTLFAPKEAAKAKSHGTKRRSTLSSVLQHTIDSGSVGVRRIVQLPSGEDLDEWIAANTVDFYNEIVFFWSLVAEELKRRHKRPGEGFPPNAEYQALEMSRQSVRGGGGAADKGVRMSAPEYVATVLDWVEAQMDDPRLFPVSDMQQFPPDFASFYAKEIYTRLFRIFAVIYHAAVEDIRALGALSHLNTCFKHFFFFGYCQFHLIADKELAALLGLTKRLREDFADAAES
jgi:MOB kinase activator 1